MKACPVICLDPAVGEELAAQLELAGLPAPLFVVGRDGRIPPGVAYVAVEDGGTRTSAAWSAILGDRAVLERTIAYSRDLTAADVTKLDRIGVKYFCRKGRDLSALLRLIGVIDADFVMAGEARKAEAEALAGSLFTSTMGAFGMFATADSLDPAFFHDLSDSFQTSLRNTTLMLLVEEISRNQDTTIQHCSLVTTLATAFGTSLGLPTREVERLFMSAFFHDIGKSSIPKTVMDKPGRLTEAETRLMRTHVSTGHELLMRFPETAGEVAEVALHHHELLDGSGYPTGLRGKEIPDIVRIITIADIFTALIERRAYKPPMPADQAYDILRGMGGKLDQDLVGVFESVAASVGHLARPVEPDEVLARFG